MNSKNLMICIGFVSAVTATSFYLIQSELDGEAERRLSESNLPETDPAIVIDDPKEQSPSDEAAISKADHHLTSESIDEADKLDLTRLKHINPHDLHKRQEWLASRGYFNNGELDAYATYDVAVLEALAEQGDVIAAHALANRLLGAGQQQKYYEAYTLAAIHGSTSALVETGRYYQRQFRKYVSQNNDAAATENLIAWLAYNDVAVRRGDVDAGIKLNQHLDIRGIEVSQADRDAAKVVSDQIYQNLEAARADRGLEKFDNSVPDYVSGYREGLEYVRQRLEKASADPSSGEFDAEFVTRYKESQRELQRIRDSFR